MQPGPYPASAPHRPPTVDPRLIRPAKAWLVVAVVIAVAGVGLAVVVMVRGIVDFAGRIDDFHRTDVPGTLEVELTDRGGYSIYHEYDGADDDTTFSFVPEPEVSVTGPSGDDVPLERYFGSVTYHASGHEGEGLYTFDVDEPGTYVFDVSGDASSGIAVGRGIGRGLVAPVVASVIIGLLSVVGGAVLAIVVGVKRSSSRRALMPAPAFRGWGPPPPGWGGPGAPGGPGPAGWPAGPAAGGYGMPGGPAPYGQGPYGQGPYGQAPYGQAPYGQGSYGPGPHGGAAAPGPYGPDGPGQGSYGPGAGDAPPPPVPPPPADVPATSGPQDAPPQDAPPQDVPPSDQRDGSPPGGGRSGPTTTAFSARGGFPAADPPSLRAPTDWARSDVPLHWSPRR